MWLTLLRILLGVDMALGLLNYVAWSWLAGQPFDVRLLLVSIFATHLPDADMIPYLLLRKRFQLYSHWIVGHHPLLLLPLAALLGFGISEIWWPHQMSYIVGLVTIGVLLHLLHDGMSSIGFPWLSPFSQKYFRFRDGKFAVVPRSEMDLRAEYWKGQKRTMAEEISGRTPPVTRTQIVLWCIGLLALIAFVLR